MISLMLKLILATMFVATPFLIKHTDLLQERDESQPQSGLIPYVVPYKLIAPNSPKHGFVPAPQKRYGPEYPVATQEEGSGHPASGFTEEHLYESDFSDSQEFLSALEAESEEIKGMEQLLEPFVPEELSSNDEEQIRKLLEDYEKEVSQKPNPEPLTESQIKESFEEYERDNGKGFRRKKTKAEAVGTAKESKESEKSPLVEEEEKSNVSEPEHPMKRQAGLPSYKESEKPLVMFNTIASIKSKLEHTLSTICSLPITDECRSMSFDIDGKVITLGEVLISLGNRAKGRSVVSQRYIASIEKVKGTPEKILELTKGMGAGALEEVESTSTELLELMKISKEDIFSEAVLEEHDKETILGLIAEYIAHIIVNDSISFELQIFNHAYEYSNQYFNIKDQEAEESKKRDVSVKVSIPVLFEEPRRYNVSFDKYARMIFLTFLNEFNEFKI